MELIFEKTLVEIKSLVKENPEDMLKQICLLLKKRIYHYDWVGFYELDDGGLVLGSYVGQPTEHKQIAIGKGICGQVAETKKTIVVQEVTQIDNYLSCSIDVKSEIVVPVMKDGEFVAELDIDSHSPAPFNPNDTLFLEQICALVADQF